MKQLLYLIPSCIKDSMALLQQLDILELPPGAKLFTTDASSMYTNIDSTTGLGALSKLLRTHKESTDPSFPTEFVLTTMEIIMNNNIFMFGDTYWIQLKGTAMGTPAATLYSILTFGHHENENILNEFQHNILFYKRYIDDIFGIWRDTPCNNWEKFKSKLDQFGTLRWNVENPSNTTTFLDLELTINHQKIYTKTFQKPLNLYFTYRHIQLILKAASKDSSQGRYFATGAKTWTLRTIYKSHHYLSKDYFKEATHLAIYSP